MAETQLRQKLLFLYLGNSSLESEVVGWSLYDGTTDEMFEAAGEDAEPALQFCAGCHARWLARYSGAFSENAGGRARIRKRLSRF